MKKLLYSLLAFLSSNVYAQSDAQKLTDDLLKDKETILARYIPMSKGKYLYQLYMMPPAEFIKKMNACKAALSVQYSQEKNEYIKLLKSKDADFNIQNVTMGYMEFYGMDSLGIVRLHQLMEEKRDDKQIDSAYKKAFVKKLDASEQERLTKFANARTDLNDESLFKRSAVYRTWLGEYVTKRSIASYKTDSAGAYGDGDLVKIKIINKEISNPFIREYLNYKATAVVIKMAKDRAVRSVAYERFMKMAINPVYRAEVEEMHANDKRMSEQGAAPDFIYTSIDDKQVSLKDLAGKYVYIDVWATWCAPCRAEIPFLVTLEKDYSNRNIHFVSISIDRMNNKSKWIDYVREHELKGIQLIADKDFNSDFVKKFNINAIPRFILIDPAGKIVSGDAKKPSDPELRKQLDLLL